MPKFGSKRAVPSKKKRRSTTKLAVQDNKRKRDQRELSTVTKMMLVQTTLKQLKDDLQSGFSPNRIKQPILSTKTYVKVSKSTLLICL